MTPMTFPFTHHTMPLTASSPSFVDWFSMEYRRRPGFGTPQRGDAVVFNFPEGDTVVANFQNQSYYQMVRDHGRANIHNPNFRLNNVVDGKEVPMPMGDILVRPLDKRENYIKRCTGVAGDTLAESLEGYFRDSEQLLTRLWLGVIGGSAVGLMLQRMPDAGIAEDDWDTLGILADTVNLEELAELSTGDLLRRLFSGYDIRLFEARTVGYDCRCNNEHLDNVIRLLGEQEVESILREQGRLELNCEFCNKSFCFAPEQARQALDDGQGDAPTMH
jgi:redox-regulated HSP33 family molecular chaperone